MSKNHVCITWWKQNVTNANDASWIKIEKWKQTATFWWLFASSLSVFLTFGYSLSESPDKVFRPKTVNCRLMLPAGRDLCDSIVILDRYRPFLFFLITIITPVTHDYRVKLSPGTTLFSPEQMRVEHSVHRFGKNDLVPISTHAFTISVYRIRRTNYDRELGIGLPIICDQIDNRK